MIPMRDKSPFEAEAFINAHIRERVTFSVVRDGDIDHEIIFRPIDDMMWRVTPKGSEFHADFENIVAEVYEWKPCLCRMRACMSISSFEVLVGPEDFIREDENDPRTRRAST